MRPNPNTWNNSTERSAVFGAENKVSSSELITRYEAQVARFVTGEDILRDKVAGQKRAMLIKSFISQGHVELVTNAKDKLNAASYIVRNDPHFIPDTVPQGHESAFIAALAVELSKPEYNQ
jgi:hypothetical protein